MISQQLWHYITTESWHFPVVHPGRQICLWQFKVRYFKCSLCSMLDFLTSQTKSKEALADLIFVVTIKRAKTRAKTIENPCEDGSTPMNYHILGRKNSHKTSYGGPEKEAKSAVPSP